MKHARIYLPLLASAAVLITSCSTMSSLQEKIANAEMQKKALSNGDTVYINFNLTPTSDWGCKTVGEPQYYNWAEIQTKGQFSLKGAHGLLMDKALAYADQEELKTNYINLVIPDEKTFTTGHDRTTTSTERNRSQAAAVYYQCQQINPNHKIGVEKRSDFSIIVNDKT